MAEPHSTVSVGVFAGAGIGLTGTFMGAQIDALVVGLMAAVFMSFWLPSVNDRAKAAAAVAVSTLFSGYGAPVAASWVSDKQASLTDGDPLRLLLALSIGAFLPILMPAILDRARTIIEGKK